MSNVLSLGSLTTQHNRSLSPSKLGRSGEVALCRSIWDGQLLEERPSLRQRELQGQAPKPRPECKTTDETWELGRTHKLGREDAKPDG